MTTDPEACWYVLGAGALGTLLAFQLQRAGQPSQLLHHGSGSLNRSLKYEGQAYALQAQSIHAMPAQSIHRLLITTKAGHVADAVRMTRSKLCENAVVIATANGIGFEDCDAIKTLSGGLHRAVTTAGAFRDDTGTVHGVSFGETRVGLPGRDEIKPPWFTDSLGGIGGWIWDPQIEQAIGQKYAINCVINALTASLRCRNGALLDDPDAHEALTRLCAESEPALRALGYWRGESLIDAAEAVCRSTAANRSSMLQDVLAGRETEIDYLNGALVEKARAFALPLNKQLVATVRGLPQTA